MVSGEKGGAKRVLARRVSSLAVAEHGNAPGLVDEEVLVDEVSQLSCDVADVLEIPVNRFAVGPAASLGEELGQLPVTCLALVPPAARGEEWGQLPVTHRRIDFIAVSEKRTEVPPIPFNRRAVYIASSSKQSAHRNRSSIVLDSQLIYQCRVFGPA